MERDDLFITDPASLKLVSLPKEDGEGGKTISRKESQVRRLVMTLLAFENLLKERCEVGIIQLLRNFPDLEEIVLVLRDMSMTDEVLERGDLDVAEIKDKGALRQGVFMTLCMEMFQPWRAFDHLWGVEMVESAVGRWIEDIVRRNGEFGFDWKPPRFKIRELRSTHQFKA
jgi:hypothetical protein